MKFYRLYTGDDKQSHFEELDDRIASKLFNTVHAVKGLVFRIEDRPQPLRLAPGAAAAMGHYPLRFG